MVMKTIGWTGRRSVKIICSALIPLFVFISLYSAVGIVTADAIDVNLLFTDLDTDDYFYDKYVPYVYSLAQTLFWLQSESNIRDMGCLEWRTEEYNEYNDYGELIQYQTYVLVSTNPTDEWYRGSISAGEFDSPRAKQMVNEAIDQQINDFIYFRNKLAEEPGLYFLISDGDRQFGNVAAGADPGFFCEQPVYRIAEPGKTVELSRTGGNAKYESGGYGNRINITGNIYGSDYIYNSNYIYSYAGNGFIPYATNAKYGYYDNSISSYIAFSSEAVNQRNDVWRLVQRWLTIQLLRLFIPVLISFALIIIIIAGAGRKYGAAANGVSFTAIDKPWLDLSLCALSGYGLLICYGFYESMLLALRYDNTRWVFALCAALAVFFTLPMLGWIVSFAKHCKAGTWWRHTLLFTILNVLLYKIIIKMFQKLWHGLRRFVKSLWAGFPHTIRAILIGFALLAANAMFILAEPNEISLVAALVLCALAVFGLLRHLRKLHLVEQGAIAASGGHYDSHIAVSGGELGRIAASINNISDGINDAVAERLKSERLKTELITNISHDIRTPLTSLITYADLLKSEGAGCERAPEYIDVLAQKAARLKTLTDDLFEASKAANGNIDVQIGALDFADLVRQVLGELDERVRGSGLDFRLNLPEHAAIRADGKLLWRVLENLLSNVFKYSLPASRVYMEIAAEGDWRRLDIKNISEHPLNIEPSELTERFKRGDGARSGDGSGLGLSIAQSFVQVQGGRFALTIDGDLFKASVYMPKQDGL